MKDEQEKKWRYFTDKSPGQFTVWRTDLQENEDDMDTRNYAGWSPTGAMWTLEQWMFHVNSGNFIEHESEDNATAHARGDIPAPVAPPVEQPGSELERLRAENAAFRDSVDYENSPAPVLCGTCFAPAQCVRPGKHQCDWCEQRERLERENGELRAIVSALPTTADGVPIIWPMDLYAPGGDQIDSVTASADVTDQTFYVLLNGAPPRRYAPNEVYAGRGAALASRPAPATSGEGGGK